MIDRMENYEDDTKRKEPQVFNFMTRTLDLIQEGKEKKQQR